jgi:hypothetical protein
MIQKPERAMLARMDTGEVIEFLSNPHLLEDLKSAVYDEPEVSGAVAPPLQFKHGGPRQVRFQVRSITQGNIADVTRQVEFIRRLALPTAPNNVPPLAFITIGGFQTPIKIRKWQVNYNAWTPALKPRDLSVEVQATVDYGVPPPPPQPKPGGVKKAAAKQAIKAKKPCLR